MKCCKSGWIFQAVLLLFCFACGAQGQEGAGQAVEDPYEMLMRCSTATYQDAASTNTQAVFVDKDTSELHIVTVVDWDDGGRWVIEQIVPLADILVDTIITYDPISTLGESEDPVEFRHAGVEMKTESATIRVEEQREGRTDMERTWVAFFRVDDYEDRYCALQALLAIVALEQGIEMPEIEKQ